MIPLSSRITIRLAAWLAPRRLRADWKREWLAELWHKAEAGALATELRRCASGSFRDALWLRSSDRRHFIDRIQPLRFESKVLAGALLILLFSGALRAPAPPFANADRLVRFERETVLGGTSPVADQRLLARIANSPTIERMGLWRRVPGVVGVVAVAPDFFDVIGLRPRLGRSFRQGDTVAVAMLSNEDWRSRFRSDPAILGRTARCADRARTVIGVLPPHSWPEIGTARCYVPLVGTQKADGVVALLKPGVTAAAAQAEVRAAGRALGLRWIADTLELRPVQYDTRLQELGFGFGIAALAAVLAVLFLAHKGLERRRYWLSLAGRVFMLALAICAVRLATLQWLTPLGPYSLFHLWIFMLMVCAATLLTVIDHRERCPTCLRRLKRPAPIGRWSSLILEQPGTEYVCLAGHGALYVPEAANAAPEHWTVFDETWQELFQDSDSLEPHL
jgi:hypothetical protein